MKGHFCSCKTILKTNGDGDICQLNPVHTGDSHRLQIPFMAWKHEFIKKNISLRGDKHCPIDFRLLMPLTTGITSTDYMALFFAPSCQAKLLGRLEKAPY